jgi:Pectate lyase superfamily protein
MSASLFGQGSPVNVNVNGTLVPQSFIATVGQTVFNITGWSYTPGTNSLLVFINGQRQVVGRDFVETSSTSFTLLEGCVVGDFVDVIGFPQIDLTAVSPGTIFLGNNYSLANYVADDRVNVKGYPYLAKGDGVTDDTAALKAAFTSGKAWYIPPGDYLISSTLTISESGICDGRIVTKSGFSGHAVDIVNPVYAKKLLIIGLNVYSTDVRPSPYGILATLGIFVGANSTYIGNTPCPGVVLINPKSTRFSVGLWIGTFNVSVYGGEIIQNDHNILAYTFDTNYNQINDILLDGVTADSAASVVSKPYALRIGTIGNNTYPASPNQGVNINIRGCNFDGAYVYIDNIWGLSFIGNYCELPISSGLHEAAITIGSAGAGTLNNININTCWFNNFDYAIEIKAWVKGVDIGVNSYASITYGAVKVNVAQSQTSISYKAGVYGGSTPNWGGGGYSEVHLNYDAGSALSDLGFDGYTIDYDGLRRGSQLVKNQASTTNWYPYGITNDGWKQIASTLGRFRSGAAIQTNIAGTQAGNIFTFTTKAQSQLFNGGDRISASAGGATYVKSVDHFAGTAILDSSFTGATNLSHNAAYFIGANLSGSGSPQGGIVANPGSLFLNSAGGANTTLYIKESGTGNTGWVAK